MSKIPVAKQDDSSRYNNKKTVVDIIKRNRGRYSYCIFTESGTCKMLSKFPSSNRHMPWNGTSSAQSVGKKETKKKTTTAIQQM